MKKILTAILMISFLYVTSNAWACEQKPESKPAKPEQTAPKKTK